MRTERSEQSSFVCGERELHQEHSLLGGAFPDAKNQNNNNKKPSMRHHSLRGYVWVAVLRRTEAPGYVARLGHL